MNRWQRLVARSPVLCLFLCRLFDRHYTFKAGEVPAFRPGFRPRLRPVLLCCLCGKRIMEPLTISNFAAHPLATTEARHGRGPLVTFGDRHAR